MSAIEHQSVEPATNRYLKHVQYGNQSPRQPNEDLSVRTDWLFEVVFDYGEHDLSNPKPQDVCVWTVRNDPFSSYRPGFEVRTYRLCQRVLMFHYFPQENEVGQDCLVRSLNYTYSYEEHPADVHNPIFSLLLSISQTGYKRTVDGTGYIQKFLPPLEAKPSLMRPCGRLIAPVWKICPLDWMGLAIGRWIWMAMGHGSTQVPPG